MPANIYQGGFATDTIQAGKVMTITSSVSATDAAGFAFLP